MEKKFDIAALGELLIDFTDAGADENGTHLFEQNPGGAPANVLVAAAHMGAETAFVGKVGNDMHGAFLKNVLEAEKICTDYMKTDDEVFTTLAFVQRKENGEREFSFARKPGADTRLRAEELDLKMISECGIFHTGSLSLTEEPVRGATFQAVETAKKAGSIISYDPNYRASLWKNKENAIKHMRSLIPYADVMKISDEETELLSGEKEVEKAAARLFEQGVRVAVVTLGSDGAYVYSKNGGQTVPGFKSQAVDTNGAGDSFWGGFLYKLSASGKKPEELTKEELYEYVRFGNALASLCVEGKGAIPAMPHAEQVAERLKER